MTPPDASSTSQPNQRIISVGADHAGFELKEFLKNSLENSGFEVIDVGCDSNNSVDYPDFGYKLTQTIESGRSPAGILCCGSGIGMSITANKVHRIRAAVCHDELTAQMAKRHNDANVLCLPADLVGDALMQSIVKVWMNTEFEGGRHQRRVDKINEFEDNQCADKHK